MKIIISILIVCSIFIFILCLFYSYKNCTLDLYDKDILNYKKDIIEKLLKDSLVVKNLNNTPIYAINMKKSILRRKNLKKQFDKFNIKNYKFIDAIEGSKITTEDNLQRKPA